MSQSSTAILAVCPTVILTVVAVFRRHQEQPARNGTAEDEASINAC